MVSGKQGFWPKFGPSDRILELARHKTSKSVWETTPCGTLRWGNQDPIWPVSPRVQAPSPRIQELSRPKRDLSAGGQWRKEEMAPSSTPNQQYHNMVRLSTPKSRKYEEVSPPQTPQWGGRFPRMRTPPITPRLLQLSKPKQTHPDFQGERETSAPRGTPTSQRLVQLSLPRMRGGKSCSHLGRPEDPIWTKPPETLINPQKLPQKTPNPQKHPGNHQKPS
ncbi:uncharacterized protein spmap2l [Menidia menidia]